MTNAAATAPVPVANGAQMAPQAQPVAAESEDIGRAEQVVDGVVEFEHRDDRAVKDVKKARHPQGYQLAAGVQGGGLQVRVVPCAGAGFVPSA